MNRFRTLVAGVLVASGASVGLAQPAGPEVKHDHAHEPAVAPTPKKGAKITFERARHDFGRVLDQETVTTTFRFTNVGTEILVLGEAQGSCSCTVGKLAKKEYAPGESGEITVEFDPRNRKGPQHRTVTVLSNDPDAPRYTLNVDAFVRSLIEIEPNFIRFGQVQRGTAQTMLVDITGLAPGFTVNAATLARGEWISAELFPVEEVVVEGEPARRATVMVSLSDTAHLGTHNAQILLKMTDAKGTNLDRYISVMTEVIGVINLLPNRLNLGLVDKGASWERQIRVMSRDGTPFTIKGVEEKPLPLADGKDAPKQLENLTVSVQPVSESDKTSYLVTIRGSVLEDAVAVTTDVVLITDVKDEEKVPLRMTGRVRQASAAAPPTRPVAVTPAAPEGKPEPTFSPVNPRAEQKKPD